MNRLELVLRIIFILLLGLILVSLLIISTFFIKAYIELQKPLPPFEILDYDHLYIKVIDSVLSMPALRGVRHLEIK